MTTNTSPAAAPLAAKIVDDVAAAGIPSVGLEAGTVQVYTIEPERVVELVEIATRHGVRVDLVAPSLYRLAP